VMSFFSDTVLTLSEGVRPGFCFPENTVNDLDAHFDSFSLATHDNMAIALMHFGPWVNLAISFIVFGSNDCS